MSLWVEYEWDIETVDAKSGDILDHDQREILSDYHSDDLKQAINEGHLALVRDDENGRSWAYVNKAGALSEYSSEAGGEVPAHKIPKKFHKELAQQLKVIGFHQ